MRVVYLPIEIATACCTSLAMTIEAEELPRQQVASQ